MSLSSSKNKFIKYIIVALVGIMLGAYIHLVMNLMEIQPKKYDKAQVIDSASITTDLNNKNTVKPPNPSLVDLPNIATYDTPIYYRPYISNLDDIKKEEISRLFANSSFVNKSCPTSTNDFVFFPEQIVNRVVGLGGFVPGQLVNLSPTVPTTFSDLCLDHLAALYLAKMIRAAEKEGIDLTVSSAYRSLALQERFYKAWLENKKLDSTETSDVSVPGHSEHQLGTVIDLSTQEIKNSPYNPKFSETKAYLWLKQNANQFGFYESYPLSIDTTKTDYQNEPWHWRFLGI